MYYGFETDEQWLVNHAKTHRKAYRLPITNSSVFNIINAVTILQKQTGIKQLTAEPAYAIEDHDIPENGTPIVAVCSNLKSSFRNRPSQSQVDHLKEIMGAGEPKWWLLDPALID